MDKIFKGILLPTPHLFYFFPGSGLHFSIWDLISQPEIKLEFPELGTWSFNHWTTREIPRVLFNHKKIRKFCHCDKINRAWGHYAKWNESDRQILYVWPHLYMGKKISVKKKSRFVATKGWSRGEGRRNWRKVVQSYKLPVIKKISTINVMYNLMILVNTGEWYIWKFLIKRVNSKSSHLLLLVTKSCLFVTTRTAAR